MPVPALQAPDTVIRLREDLLLLAGPASGAREARFIPESTPGVEVDRPQALLGAVAGGRYRLEIPLKIEPENALGGPLRVAGLIVFRSEEPYRMIPSISFELPVPTAEDPPTSR